MKKPYLWRSILAPLSFVLLLSACNNEQAQDIASQANTDGSIETSLSVEHIEGFDVVITTHRVWAKGQNTATIEHRDTIPALSGDMINAPTEYGGSETVYAQKDYEFYITVK